MVKDKFSIESYYNELSQKAAELSVDNYYRSFEYPSNTKRVISNSEDIFFCGAEWQRNNLWIPVSEHLPLCIICGCYSEDVLIFNHNYAATVGYYDKILNKWLFSNWDEDIEIMGVTHWMPIPKINNI